MFYVYNVRTQALEELLWQAGELLDRLDDLQEDVARADFADDVTGARRAIDAHADISKRLAKVPVDELEAQGKPSGPLECAHFVTKRNT